MPDLPAAEDLTATEFCRHMNQRHMGDLSGPMWEERNDNVEYLPTTRAYHRQLHRAGKADHEHEESLI